MTFSNLYLQAKSAYYLWLDSSICLKLTMFSLQVIGTYDNKASHFS